MPHRPGMAGAGDCFFGTSATIASVVIGQPAIEAASCSAVRTTFVGSMIPFDTRFSNLPLCASKPKVVISRILHDVAEILLDILRVAVTLEE